MTKQFRILWIMRNFSRSKKSYTNHREQFKDKFSTLKYDGIKETRTLLTVVASYLLNHDLKLHNHCKPKPATRGGTQRMSEATIEQLRAGGTVEAEGHLPHQILANQLTLFQPWRGRLCPPCYCYPRIFRRLCRASKGKQG